MTSSNQNLRKGMNLNAQALDRGCWAQKADSLEPNFWIEPEYPKPYTLS